MRLDFGLDGILQTEGLCRKERTSKESQERWFSPVVSCVTFKGIEAEGFAELPEDTRPKIEFVGDSITEGLSILVEPEHYFAGNNSVLYRCDSTLGYAYLTAKKLNFRPYIMGYGALGVTHSGNGNVPEAPKAYCYYSDGCPMESINADYIVINHGTNDAKMDKTLFREKYTELISVVRKRNLHSKIICLTPFGGYLAEEIEDCVTAFNKENNDCVFFINSTGWISPTPLHPLRDGHETASDRLADIIKNRIV